MTSYRDCPKYGKWGFKIKILSRWRLCGKALSAALRGLKAQQVQSPGQRPGLRTGCPFRALLLALCSFIMCACFATCYLAQNCAEIFLDFNPPLHPTQKTIDVGLQCFIVRIVQEEIAQLRLFAFWHLQGNPCACLFCRHVVAHHDAF